MSELTHLLRSKAVLMPGVTVSLSNEKTKDTQTWQYKGGLSDYLMQTLSGDPVVPLFEGDGFADGQSEQFAEGEGASWAVAFTEDGAPVRESYVNLIPTSAGGTHDRLSHGVATSSRAPGVRPRVTTAAGSPHVRAAGGGGAPRVAVGVAVADAPAAAVAVAVPVAVAVADAVPDAVPVADAVGDADPVAAAVALGDTGAGAMKSTHALVLLGRLWYRSAPVGPNCVPCAMLMAVVLLPPGARDVL
jgi:hypothetical protein